MRSAPVLLRVSSALLLALSAAAAVGADEPAAVLAAIKKDRFTVFTVAGGLKVEVTRLLDGLEKPPSPPRLAWLEPDGALRTGTEEDFLRLAPASPVPSERKVQEVKGVLHVSREKASFSRNMWDTDRTAVFTFVDGSNELEVACLVVSDPGPPPPTYRVAFGWRVRRGSKVRDYGSSQAVVMEGQEVPIPVTGSSAEDAFQVRFRIDEK